MFRPASVWSAVRTPVGHFGAAGGGGAKIWQTRIRTYAYRSGIGCATIGPLALLQAPRVPTACSLLSKNF